MANGNRNPAGADTGTLDLLPGNPDVTGQLSQAGVAFGELVRLTGDAVAQTQRKLAQTSAATASTLATTQVDVIAVQEAVYHDNGTLDTVHTYTRKLPLITFIDPVFYEWSQVRLQGVFMAQQFADGRKVDTFSHVSSDASGQGGLLVILGGGRTTFDAQGESSSTQTDVTNAVSMGNVRMNALLRPRTGIGVPKPRIEVQGPGLTLIQGAIADVMTGSALTARTMSVMVQYNRRDGAPIPNKLISIETQGASWAYLDATGTVSPTPVQTDAGGLVRLQLRREFLDPKADRSPANIVITARKGLVSNSTTVTF